MFLSAIPLRAPLSFSALCAILILGSALGGGSAIAQTAPDSPAPATTPSQPASQPESQPQSQSQPAAPSLLGPGEVNEDNLKQSLVGKQLYLRGGYLGDSLSFNEHGDPAGHPTAGSYTLSAVQIDKVRLAKHKVELEGSRYALHFLGSMPYEDPTKAVDRVKITPKKKTLKITIDREQVLKPKKAKESKEKEPKDKKAAAPEKGPDATSEAVAAAKTPPAAEQADTPDTPETPAEQAADPASVTSTISPAHAAQVLREALSKVFAQGLDEKLRAQMPQFWQLYYQAQAAGVDYRPKDPTVLRASAVDQPARLLTSIAPGSNEFAQSNGIAGRALYRAVIGPDGKPGEIAVVRPIGFGLDENAVAAIRKASFQPATKGGQPVAETLDLAVLFRIYSKKTAASAPETSDAKSPAEAADPNAPANATKPAKPILPGPYTAKALAAQPAETTPAPEAAPSPETTPAAPPAPTPPDPQAPQTPPQ